MNLPDQRTDNYIPSPLKREGRTEKSIEEITDLQDINIRRTGRTTRLVNEYIERLFKEHTIIVRDHYPTQLASKYMANMLKKRMEFEHRKKVRVEEFGNMDVKITLI